MKTIITLIVASIISLNALSGNSKVHPEKYCAKIEGGKKVVMYQGYTMTDDITLKDGTKILPDGTVVKKDGTKTALQVGECIDKDGMIAKE
jgi:hypothetical protein